MINDLSDKPAKRAQLQRQVDDLSKQNEAADQDTNGAASRPGPGAPGSGGSGALPSLGNSHHSGSSNPTDPHQQNTADPNTDRHPRPSARAPQRDATPERAEDPTQQLPPLPPFTPGPDVDTYTNLQFLWNKCDVARSMVLYHMKNYADCLKTFGATHRFVREAEVRLKNGQLEFAQLRQRLREVLPDTPGPTTQTPGGSSPQSPNPSQLPPGQPSVKLPQGGGNTAADFAGLRAPAAFEGGIGNGIAGASSPKIGRSSREQVDAMDQIFDQYSVEKYRSLQEFYLCGWNGGEIARIDNEVNRISVCGALHSGNGVYQVLVTFPKPHQQRWLVGAFREMLPRGKWADVAAGETVAAVRDERLGKLIALIQDLKEAGFNCDVKIFGLPQYSIDWDAGLVVPPESLPAWWANRHRTWTEANRNAVCAMFKEAGIEIDARWGRPSI